LNRQFRKTHGLYGIKSIRALSSFDWFEASFDLERKSLLPADSAARGIFCYTCRQRIKKKMLINKRIGYYDLNERAICPS
jgi:hypothetical protein